MKFCKRCQKEKSLDHYTRCGQATKDGHRPTCKDCEKSDPVVASTISGGEALIAFGTPIERASAETLIRCGSLVNAATEMQMDVRTLRGHLSELARRAATKGYAPASDMIKTVPDGFHVKGVSTFYGADGAVRGQWVKSNKDHDEQIQALLSAMSHVADAWEGKAEPIVAPTATLEDLLCVYPMGDPHLGMHAWKAETGDNFDLHIAERTLCAAVDQLVAGAPAAKEALIIDLGDFFHADSTLGQTTGGTRVDVDTRWAKMIRVGIRAMRRCIDRALAKHEIVRVWIVKGNHDWHTSIMLALCLEQFYAHEPRVVIDTSPSPYYWHRFGTTLIAATHGHNTKPSDLGAIMACDRKEDWAATDHRFWYTGHVHHDTLKEYPGVVVETFRTLAPKDAWHNEKGYRSGRDMKMDVIHRTRGRIQRNTVGIQELGQ